MAARLSLNHRACGCAVRCRGRFAPRALCSAHRGKHNAALRAPHVQWIDATARQSGARFASRRARGLPARLPGYVCDACDGRKWPRDRDPGRAGSSDHRRHAVHEGRALSRPDIFARPVALSDAQGRRKGRRPLRAHLVGRGARRDRRSLCGDRRFGGRTAGDPAVQLCGHDGAAAGLVDGSPFLPSSRRVAARSHDLRVRGQGRVGGSRRRVDGNGCRGIRRQQADPDLGQQPGHVEPAFLDARAGSEAARREADRDRSVSQRDRRKVPRAHRAAAGHRRRAGLRHHARADRATDASIATTSIATRSASTRSRSARANGRPSASRRSAAFRASRSSGSRTTTARSSRRLSGSITACSVFTAAATPCARSRACRR